jgi:hypothetical protein
LSEYLVGYGLTGELGRFRGPESLRRGDRVVIESPRGREMGEILRPSSARLGDFLGSCTQGAILRRATSEDEAELERQRQRAEAFRAAVPGLLDAELLLDGETILVQAAGPQLPQIQLRATTLAAEWGLRLTVFNAGLPLPESTDADGGCGSCDSDGGCGSCDSGGGCGSGGCGSGGCGGETSDVRAYFAQLRERMEHTHRVPLL